MGKRKVLIFMLLFLLLLLIVYLILSSTATKETNETTVSFPYTNWMSEPEDNSSDNSDDNGVIVFEQDK